MDEGDHGLTQKRRRLRLLMSNRTRTEIARPKSDRNIAALSLSTAVI